MMNAAVKLNSFTFSIGKRKIYFMRRCEKCFKTKCTCEKTEKALSAKLVARLCRCGCKRFFKCLEKSKQELYSLIECGEKKKGYQRFSFSFTADHNKKYH